MHIDFSKSSVLVTYRWVGHHFHHCTYGTMEFSREGDCWRWQRMQDHWKHFASFIHNCTHRRAVELAQSEECCQKPCYAVERRVKWMTSDFRCQKRKQNAGTMHLEKARLGSSSSKRGKLRVVPVSGGLVPPSTLLSACVSQQLVSQKS